MADKKVYLDQEGLEKLVNYIKNELSQKANKGDIVDFELPDDVVRDADLVDYAKKDEVVAQLPNDLVYDADIADVVRTSDIADVVREDALEDLATKNELDAVKEKATAAYHVKGSVANLAALQTIEEPQQGDVYNLEDTGINAVWTGSEWDELGTFVDVTPYLKIEDAYPIGMDILNALLYSGKSAVVSDKASLDAMLANDEPEVEITLNSNITSNIAIPANKKVILDLGGNSARTISANGEGSEVVIKNGTVESGSSAAAVAVSNGAKATINDGAEIIGTRNNGIEINSGSEVVVNGGNISAHEAGIYPSGGAVLTINGGKISCIDNGGLMMNGSPGKGGNTVVMNGGRIEGHIQSAGYLACGVYLPNDDVFTMNGGEIISDGVGIVLRGGKAILNGGVVEGNGATGIKGKVGDSRVVVGPYAVVYDSESAYPAKDSLELVVGADMVLRGTDGAINVIGENPNITDNRI